MEQKQTKVCPTCKQELPLSSEYFYKNKHNKNGFHYECKNCNKKYRQENKERKKEYSKKYYEENREKILQLAKQHYQDNKQELNQKHKEYIKNNKSKINQYKKDRRLKIPSLKLHNNISRSINKSLNKVDNSKNKQSIFNYLPYSLEELKQHLESLFQEGMDWSNYGCVNGWSIDHIIPSAYFNYQSMEDPKFLECWSLSNLRPLWAKDNCSKNSLHEGKRWKYRNC